MSLIPDICTFPRGLQQIRTVVTAYTWVNKDGGGNITSSSEIALVMAPTLLNAFSPYKGAYDTPTASKVTDPFSVFNYSQWVSLCSNYRPAQLGFTCQYIGPAMNNSGQVTSACFPPWSNVPVPMLKEKDKEKKDGKKKKEIGVPYPINWNYDLVAAYTFAYSGAARDGAEAVWFPATTTDFDVRPIDTIIGSTSPQLLLAAKGLPLPEAPTDNNTTNYLAVFNIDVVVNIETFAVSQVLTTTQKAGRPDVASMNHAMSVMSAAHAKGATAGKSGSVYKQIVNAAKSAAGVVWENRDTLIPLAIEAGTLLV